MSQTTRCPHCATAFRVVADQLRVSDGWVRCGHCQEVFDALQSLRQPVRPPPDGPQLAQEEGEPIPAFLRAPEPEAPALADEEAPPDVPLPLPAAQSPAEALPWVDEPPPPGRDEPQFVRAARRGAVWRQPRTRALLVLAASLLALLLAAQALLQQRDALAARHPAVRTLLQPLCALRGCTLQAPRDPAALVIDSSSFMRLRLDDDRYELRLALRNLHSHAVAMPLLELTLTDADERVLVRRVLDPARELGAPAELAPLGSWGAATPVQVPGAPVAGYRLLAFYP